MRYRFIVGAVLAMFMSCETSSAKEDMNSANYMMPGCRALTSNREGDAFKRGLCGGTVETLVKWARNVCSPNHWTIGQSVRIVVRYIDTRPERMHEDFGQLAHEALRAAWPCSK